MKDMENSNEFSSSTPGLEEIASEFNKILATHTESQIDSNKFEEILEETVARIWRRWNVEDPELRGYIAHCINSANREQRKSAEVDQRKLKAAVDCAQNTLDHAKYANRLATDNLNLSDKPSTLTFFPDSEHVGGRTLFQLVAVGTHARLLSVCDDVVFLCANGRLDSARARARTLCETLIIQTALMLKRTEQFEIVERYYVWSQTELGDNADKELKEQAKRLWGTQFFKNFAWASPLFSPKRASRINLHELAHALGMDNLYAHYKEFNHEVHVGPAKLIHETDFNSEYPFSTRSSSSLERCARVLHLTVVLIQQSSEVMFRALAQVTGDYQGIPYLGMINESAGVAIAAAVQASGREK